MTLAEKTREAVRSHPFLHDALRAGVVNYSAAARFLDVDGDTDAGRASSSEPSVAETPEDAVVAALRRFADDLPDYERHGSGPPVSMQRGLGDGDPAEALLVVGDRALVPDAGSLTAITAGSGDTAALRQVLGRLATAGIGVEAAGVGGGSLVVVVGRRDGPDAVRAVEDALGG